MSGRFNLNDYITVDERIDQFWAQYPDGAIRTEVAYTNNDASSVAVRASVYKRCEQPHPDATGIAQEERLTGEDQYGKPVKGANTSSWWENCETSAIGRALANLGMSLSKQRPSRSEMEKVQRYEDAPQPLRQQQAQSRAPQPQAQHRPAQPQPAALPAPTGPDDDNLLGRIRDDTAAPGFRQKALHAYYDRAATQAALDERADNVRLSGLPEEDLRKAHTWHKQRIAALAPPAPDAPRPASYAG